MPKVRKAATSAAVVELGAEIGQFFADPLGFVLFAYPWGVEGTILSAETGPDQWQRELLNKIGRKILENSKKGIDDAIREAVASGHGIGKSALVA